MIFMKLKKSALKNTKARKVFLLIIIFSHVHMGEISNIVLMSVFNLDILFYEIF